MTSLRFLVATAIAFGMSLPTRAASFQGLGMLPGTALAVDTLNVSADGSIVVGSIRRVDHIEAFRWSDDVGMIGLGNLPGAGTYSWADDVSADGSVVVGRSGSASQTQPTRWSAAEGMVSLANAPGGATGVSDDGSVIVGAANLSGRPEAFRWTSEGGVVGLGLLPNQTRSVAHATNRDGSVIVGELNDVSAFRWTNEGGMVPLTTYTAPDYVTSIARGVSGDGSVVVGDLNPQTGGREGFRWTADEGMVGLGVLASDFVYSQAFDVSADGSMIVGTSFSPQRNWHAVLWDANNHIIDLRELLIRQGAPIGRWELLFAQGISADGRTIVGWGFNDTTGDEEAWIATIDAVPEPSSLSLATFASLGSLTYFMRRRVGQFSWRPTLAHGVLGNHKG